MSTWTSRATAILLAASGLAGCDPATGLPFAAELDALSDDGRARMAQTTLAGGDITIAAPDGYCIDRRSLRRAGQNGFVVMARCDTLGVRGFFGGYDLAVITVTAGPADSAIATPTPADVARSVGQGKVLNERNRDGVAMVRLDQGSEKFDGVSETHWRGGFVLNSHLVGLGLYAPAASGALGNGGAALLGELAERSRAATAASE
jgi:hypothetical protein